MNSRTIEISGNDFIAIGIVAGLIVIIVYLLLRLQQSANKIKQVEDRFKEVEASLNSIQLEKMDAKLNPHLIKNILNSIQSHAYQTYYAIDKLASVLDYLLYDSHKEYVTPKEEIEFALNLVEINKIKLSPLFDLKTKLKVNEREPLYHQKILAPLISIDLIENAFKHADLQSPGAFISISFEFTDSIFSLTVANKISAKVPMKKGKSGIGKEIMEKRLRIIYGKDYSFNTFTEDDVFISHLKINLLEHKAKMLATRR